jgi:sphinganine-1-phosphate aldolase
VADVMEKQFQWKMERQQKPDCLHMTLMPTHFHTKEKFIEDLTKATQMVKENPNLATQGTASMYGMVARVPAASIINNFLRIFMGKVYQ